MKSFDTKITEGKKSLDNIRGIFEKNKIQFKLDTIESISSKENFWKDQNKVKTLLKEKNF